MVADSETPGVDTQDLRAFGRVVDLGSVSAAAKALGETKGATSRRLSRLEARLGVALVTRTARRVVPTEDGRAFRERLGAALDALDDAIAHARHADHRPHGHLRVTAPVDLGAWLVAPMIGPFTEAWPGITVELLLTDARLSFRDHEVDLALRAAASLDDSSLVARKLARPRGVLVASADYLARHGAPEDPEDLAAHRVLGLSARGRVQAFTFRHADGRRTTVKVPIHVAAGDTRFLAAAAAHGAGIVLLPDAAFVRELAGDALVRVLPAWEPVFEGGLYVLHAPEPLPAKVRVFRDALLAYLPSLPGFDAR